MLHLRVFILLLIICADVHAASLFNGQTFNQQDAVLVTDTNNSVLFDWQADKPLIPASTIKIITAQMAIEKWGVGHRFNTDFFLVDKTLWVKGYADPYLISEEIDKIVTALTDKLKTQGLNSSDITEIRVDDGFLKSETVPGRTQVLDPYNAPLSAVAANFNTAMISNKDGHISSAEQQTPLTKTAKRLAAKLGKKTDRINLLNRQNAQQHFAEILASKLNAQRAKINIDQNLPAGAELLYRHNNSHTLSDVIKGMLMYSNNFIANQLFLLLGAQQKNDALLSTSLSEARTFAQSWLKTKFSFSDVVIDDGAGLSRANQFSAEQLHTVMQAFKPNHQLLKHYSINNRDVYAKTGTLKDIRTFAGYVDTEKGLVSFVFLLNQAKPYKYRETLLKQLVQWLNQKAVP